MDKKDLRDMLDRFMVNANHAMYGPAYLYGASLIVGLVSSFIFGSPFWHALLRSIVFFGIGVQSIVFAALYVRYPRVIATLTGWSKSNYQLEAAAAYLSFGISGLLVLFKASWATPIGFAGLLFFVGGFYAYYAGIKKQDLFGHPNEGGNPAPQSFVYGEILIVVTLLISLMLS